eukprot:g6329.t1
MELQYERRDELYTGDLLLVSNVREDEHHLLSSDGFNSFDLETRRHVLSDMGGADSARFAEDGPRFELDDCLFRFTEGGDKFRGAQDGGEGGGVSGATTGAGFASPRSPRGGDGGGLSPRGEGDGDTLHMGRDPDGGDNGGGGGVHGHGRGALLHFGQTVQLQHVKSGKYLCASATKVASRDAECMQLTLADSSESSQFEIVSVLRIQTEGTPVRGTNSVRLRATALGEHYLHSSADLARAPPSVQMPFNDGCEVNATEYVNAQSSWRLLLYRKASEHAAEETMLLGSHVSFLHSQTSTYLSGSLGDGGGMVMESEAAAFSLKTFFSFEHPDELVGGAVHWSTPYLLRHLCSGAYLRRMPGADGAGHIVFTRVRAEAGFFSIEPNLATDTASGPVSWAHVRKHGCDIAARDADEELVASSPRYWLQIPHQQDNKAGGRGAGEGSAVIGSPAQGRRARALSEPPPRRVSAEAASGADMDAGAAAGVDADAPAALRFIGLDAPPTPVIELHERRSNSDAICIHEAKTHLDWQKLNFLRSCVRAAERYVCACAGQQDGGAYERDSMLVCELTGEEGGDPGANLQGVLDAMEGMIDRLVALLEQLAGIERKNAQTIVADLNMIDALMWCCQVPFLCLAGPDDPPGVALRKHIPPALYRTQNKVTDGIVHIVQDHARNQEYFATRAYDTCWSFPCLGDEHEGLHVELRQRFNAMKTSGPGTYSMRGGTAAGSPSPAPSRVDDATHPAGRGSEWLRNVLQQMLWECGMDEIFVAATKDNLGVIKQSLKFDTLRTLIYFLSMKGVTACSDGFCELDVLSAVCHCNGQKVETNQGAILRAVVSERNFERKMDDGSEFTRHDLFIETCRSADAEHWDPYAPWAEKKDLYRLLEEPDDGEDSSGRKQRWARILREGGQEDFEEGRVHLIVQDRRDKTAIKTVVVDDVDGLRRYSEQILNGTAHIDRGQSFLGREMFMRGIPRLLVGFNRESGVFSASDDQPDRSGGFRANQRSLFRCRPCQREAECDPPSNVWPYEEIRAAPEGSSESMETKVYHDLDSFMDYMQDLRKEVDEGTVPEEFARRKVSKKYEWVPLEELAWVLEPETKYKAVFGGRDWDEGDELRDEDNRKRFENQRHHAMYYNSQIRLLANLAFGQNARCIRALQKLMPFELVYCGMHDENLPMSTRTAFTELMIHLWVAVHPYHELKLPACSRMYNDLARDPLLGGAEGALAQASHRHRYNFQLLMFLTSDFFVDTDGQKKHAKVAERHRLVLANLTLQRTLARFGFFGTAKGIRDYLCNPLLSAMDGRRELKGHAHFQAAKPAPSNTGGVADATLAGAVQIVTAGTGALASLVAAPMRGTFQAARGGTQA